MSSSGWKLVSLSVVVAVLGTLLWLFETAPAISGTRPGGPVLSYPGGVQPSAGTRSLQGASAATTPEGRMPAPFNPLDKVAPPTFRASAQGELVIDAQTRTDVERLLALYDRAQATSMLNALSEHLPAQARRELQMLYQQQIQYEQAVARSFPPQMEVDSPEKAVQQLDGLHDLRVQYFGADHAEQLFGEEERTTREMLSLMPSNANLSIGEKAALAQEAWSARHPVKP
jgi:Proteobacterial lipase chaperone protein